ncbi:MAG: hypothetical protein Q8Q35_03270 [Nanoarchaeota archaeon]|nr:hypothetical protein [Nanoarchaeota archaeon]
MRLDIRRQKNFLDGVFARKQAEKLGVEQEYWEINYNVNDLIPRLDKSVISKLLGLDSEFASTNEDVVNYFNRMFNSSNFGKKSDKLYFIGSENVLEFGFESGLVTSLREHLVFYDPIYSVLGLNGGITEPKIEGVVDIKRKTNILNYSGFENRTNFVLDDLAPVRRPDGIMYKPINSD